MLHCEPVAARAFPNWSVGSIGNSPCGRALWSEVARLTDFDQRGLEDNVLFNTLLSIVKKEEGEAAQASTPVSGVIKLDGPQLCTKLAVHMSPERAAPPPITIRSDVPAPSKSDAPALAAQEIEAGVLRTALGEDRSRTTALRRELDEAHIEIATLHADLTALYKEVEALRRHCDIWADRVKAMAAIMTRDPTLEIDDDLGAA